jgi:hypothetical protein
MKEIEIMLSDEQIKEMWDLKKKINLPKEIDDECNLTYEEYYKKHKKPMKALLG